MNTEVLSPDEWIELTPIVRAIWEIPANRRLGDEVYGCRVDDLIGPGAHCYTFFDALDQEREKIQLIRLGDELVRVDPEAEKVLGVFRARH